MLPIHLKLPKELPVSRNVISLCANPCGEGCYKIADTAYVHIGSYVYMRKARNSQGINSDDVMTIC